MSGHQLEEINEVSYLGQVYRSLSLFQTRLTMSQVEQLWAQYDPDPANERWIDIQRRWLLHPDGS